MKDFGRSDDPRVQAQLDRLGNLTLREGRFNLDTVHELFDRLGNPQDRLPPVFHVAGTNGKGSTCAFLRAMMEAEGYSVHATTSPHLVRYNERIRLAGKLIEDARLAELLEEVFDAAEGLEPSFFEVTIAASFLEFSRVPADACVIEVGLGGRLDATNVLEPEVLAACGIAALGIDHERFLLAPEEGTPEEPKARIAFEKAGIAKEGVPLVTMSYPGEATLAIKEQTEKVDAPLILQTREWRVSAAGNALVYVDAAGELTLPLPSLAGPHQAENAALAVAMLRHQSVIPVSPQGIAKGILNANWPARLQQLEHGPLTKGREVWLDGGHNLSAGQMLGKYFAGQNLHVIIGMLEGKDPRAIIGPLEHCIRTLTIVPVPGHDSHPSGAFGPNAKAASGVEEALLNLPADEYPALIAGSLYLAGEVLRLNHEIPD